LRSAKTIVNAFELFQAEESMDSLRAMEITNSHPGKMWRLGEDNHATPFLTQINHMIPTHDSPTQSLEKLWIQTLLVQSVHVPKIFIKLWKSI
jgi:hypothetical protein